MNSRWSKEFDLFEFFYTIGAIWYPNPRQGNYKDYPYSLFFTFNYSLLITLMSLLISWSVAFDTIIQTVGDFRSQDNTPTSDLHLSLFSPAIRKEYGGTAANIAYSLALLGETPHIIASIGEDGSDYLVRLRELSIQTELIQTIPGSYCPQAYIVRDGGNGQINVFHPGAMSASGEISHGNITFSHAIVAPDSREGILRRVDECTSQWIFTIFDPGQAMGILSAEELRSCVVKSHITIMNEPERAQFESIVGEDFVNLCRSYGHTAIVTLWEEWSIIISESSEIWISALYIENILDATGCGDAYRAGLLYGLSHGWNITKSAQLWSILWGIKIQSMGGQNHSFTRDQIDEIGTREFGEKFFA